MTTVQKVGAVLRKAGFERSRRLRSGQIKGWGHSTEGYKVRAYRTFDRTGVEVQHIEGSWARGTEAERAAEVADKLASYRGALVAVGLTVAVKTTPMGTDYLFIANPEEAK